MGFMQEEERGQNGSADGLNCFAGKLPEGEEEQVNTL